MGKTDRKQHVACCHCPHFLFPGEMRCRLPFVLAVTGLSYHLECPLHQVNVTLIASKVDQLSRNLTVRKKNLIKYKKDCKICNLGSQLIVLAQYDTNVIVYLRVQIIFKSGHWSTLARLRFEIITKKTTFFVFSIMLTAKHSIYFCQ